MLKNQPWSTKPFQLGSPLQMPIYDLISGEFSGDVWELDQKNFNQPLRRDIVQNVFHYFRVKGKLRTKVAKT